MEIKKVIEPVEPGSEFLESIEDLNIDWDNISFTNINSITNVRHDEINVYDLEVENIHNYHIDNCGIVHNGGGKRKGSIAIYLEPWHGDIFTFLDLKKNHGKEEMRARDLFLAIWMNDLFMQRVEQDLDWHLMCPNECPGLNDTYSEEFIELYESYEAQGKFLKKVKARDVWYKILESQIETGVPYITYKDSVNVKSNQKNIGVIKNSNLCLTADTLIKAKINGVEKELTIQELNGINNQHVDIEVLSYNLESGKNEYKEVISSALTSTKAKLMKIVDVETGNSISCTPDHNIFTSNRGYVMAKNLKEDDKVLIEK